MRLHLFMNINIFNRIHRHTLKFVKYVKTHVVLNTKTCCTKLEFNAKDNLKHLFSFRGPGKAKAFDTKTFCLKSSFRKSKDILC